MRAEPESAHFGIESLPNPDEQPAFNGEVYPDGLYDLLLRIDRDYGNRRSTSPRTGRVSVPTTID